MNHRMFLIAAGLVLAGCVSQDDRKAETTQQTGVPQTASVPSPANNEAGAPDMAATPMAPAARAATPPSTTLPVLQPALPAASVAVPLMPPPPVTTCRTKGDTTVCTGSSPPDPDGDRYNTN